MKIIIIIIMARCEPGEFSLPVVVLLVTYLLHFFFFLIVIIIAKVTIIRNDHFVHSHDFTLFPSNRNTS